MREKSYTADLCVVGGGLAGVCGAITAARRGLKVVLIQDRPVLGGNASSEVRLWALGATSHMGNNNRWAREGGVIDEILVENLYRNREGNPVIFDTVLLDKVTAEPNITLLLNTAVSSLEMHDPESIRSVRGFCSQNATWVEVAAPLFCDASGDGIVGDLAGAIHRMGAEKREEFGEKFAPSVEYGSLMGHSLFFYSKDTGKPVKFIRPSYALKDITKIPRYRNFKKDEHGCQLWWIEYGGRLDTVHDSEEIKWELWRIVYGVWDYIKNSGSFPGAETMTLEWVGMIPGKRESRRFEGDTMLIQQDIVEQRGHYDAVSYGGWAIDLHPADGIYSNKPGCDQWHAKGIYPIPYRCMYSRNIRNLFLAGRLISVSHVACGSSRVMVTCAHNAQAVGLAAVMCSAKQVLPRALSEPQSVQDLQQELLKDGQYIPGIALQDPDDLAHQGRLETSSSLRLAELPTDGPMLQLTDSYAMLLPVGPGPMPTITLELAAQEATQLRCELRTSAKNGNFTPDVTSGEQVLDLEPTSRIARSSVEAEATQGTPQYQLYTEPNGSMHIDHDPGSQRTPTRSVALDFDVTLPEACYVFVCLMKNPSVFVRCSKTRLTGVLALAAQANERVAHEPVQKPERDIGVDTFEFWIPKRWPEGHDLAMRIDPPIDAFSPENVRNGVNRPVTSPNAWVAEIRDPDPSLTLTWDRPKTIRKIVLSFDTDADHPLESVLMGHPQAVIPTCVRRYRILDALGKTVYETRHNHQTRNLIHLDPPVTTDVLRVELVAPDQHIPAALFEIRCYE